MNWFDHYANTHGYFESEAAAFMYGLVLAAKGNCDSRQVIELGTACGRSAIVLGAACKEADMKLSTVDSYRVGGFTPEQVIRNVVAAGVDDVVSVVRAQSTEYGKLWNGGPIALLHVDAGHEHRQCMDDIKAWWDHVDAMGYVAFHDMQHDGVWGACEDLFRSRWNEIQRVGGIRTLGVYQRRNRSMQGQPI